MPKYTHPRMTSWQRTGWMDFMKYDEFSKLYEQIPDERDKHLLAFLYFTGARPGEALEIKREDISVESTRLVFKVPTLKLSKKRAEPIRRIRIVKWPNFKQFKELKALWSFIHPLPNSFYLFGWLKIYKNPRDYITQHFGMPAYFFRHNLFSLFTLAGGSRAQVRSLKGALDERSTTMYMHLSKELAEGRGRILTKAIK